MLSTASMVLLLVAKKIRVLEKSNLLVIYWAQYEKVVIRPIKRKKMFLTSLLYGPNYVRPTSCYIRDINKYEG